MKIQLASDLHLDLLHPRWPEEQLISLALDVDVLVLAGDIHQGALAMDTFAPWASNRKIPIVYVAGNHEFYGETLGTVVQHLRESSAAAGIHYLERDVIVIGGVRFLGCTLWTDYRLRSMYTQEHVMEEVQGRLMDHQRIHTDSGLFAPQDALKQHLVSRQWLAEELAKPFEGKTVVVTHHGPHPLSVHPRYVGDKLNAAYVSDLSQLMPHVDLWLHGHVHDSFDYQIGRCRVVANPAGYVRNRASVASREDFVFENQAFDAELVISLG
ncbi:metallophosphoesterase [Rhodoferax sp. TS-BS-61-7]|uniref:metallophosphoesterase n=1 Tax=Rhodoferax sp. TS-BS-61-7 TaxID=2094194 RepID=UPI000CF725DC|nr:metallophosphoesterase [Rhodoferax sp. TS-BS-61-7]PQA75953.1 metallophosphoesterase [Rhodoferax sp. TS-BS-61-7]